ncbi:hypothetical protein bcere0007_39760 [Bacillus mycoides]|nr:hypothetical protein bcere0007_39760 [Bacillus mycoides]
MFIISAGSFLVEGSFFSEYMSILIEKKWGFCYFNDSKTKRFICLHPMAIRVE